MLQYTIQPFIGLPVQRGQIAIKHNPEFSLKRRLSMWHCPRLMLAPCAPKDWKNLVYNFKKVFFRFSVRRPTWMGDRKGIRPVENWVVGCWHGYLSGARYYRLAYGPPKSTRKNIPYTVRRILLQKNLQWAKENTMWKMTMKSTNFTDHNYNFSMRFIY